MATDSDIFRKGRLITRPNLTFSDLTPPVGLRKLGLDAKRDALLYVPSDYDAAQPLPLALMLHGAGGSAEHGLSLLQYLADEYHLILLAPYSRDSSWDIINFDRFGPDIVFINQALKITFDQYAIDTEKLAVGGFSDGASYALSVGLINGDLFTHIIAFSPGFYFSPERHGKPNLFISHGIQDGILPVNSCSRRIVPKLKGKGYKTVYREFEGEHVIPESISREAVVWFTASQ